MVRARACSITGSMDVTANVAYMALLYGQSVVKTYAAKSERYICWAQGQMRDVLGDVATGFVVGFTPNGGSGYTHPQDRASSCPNPPAVCNAITGLYNPQVRFASCRQIMLALTPLWCPCVLGSVRSQA